MGKIKIYYVTNSKWAPSFEALQKNLGNRYCLAKIFTEKGVTEFDGKGVEVSRNKINKAWKEIDGSNNNFVLINGCHYIVKKKVLDKIDVLVLHPTLLPKGRKNAPLNHAIRNGDKVGGVTLFYARGELDEVDSGPIIYQRSFQIGERDNVSDLLQKANFASGEIYATLLKNWPNVPKREQDHTLATYNRRLRPEDGEILPEMDYSTRDRIIRSLDSPFYPAPFAVIDGEQRIIKGIVGETKEEGEIYNLGGIKMIIEKKLK